MYLPSRVSVIILCLLLCRISLVVAAEDSDIKTTDLNVLEKDFIERKIGLDEYLSYKCYLIFNPAKLPNKYKISVKPLKSGTPVVDQILKNWNTFSPQAQNELKELLDRPQIFNEKTFKSSEGHFLIHYTINGGIDDDGDGAVDEDPINGIDDDGDWVSFTDTNGNGVWDSGEPLNDDIGIDTNGDGIPDYGIGNGIPDAIVINSVYSIAEPHVDEDASDKVPSEDIDNDGVPDYVERFAEYFETAWDELIDGYGLNKPPSDGSEYDVYIRHLVAYGVTITDLATGISYIEVNNKYDWAPSNMDPEGKEIGAMKVTAAHEFMHAIQGAYDPREERWWKEATAVWSEDYVYSYVNDYLQYVNEWLRHPDLPLTVVNDWHEYGDVIFAKFLSEKKNTGIIKDIWEEMVNTDGITAIDNVLRNKYGTDFETVFEEFVIANYLNGLNNHDGNLANDQYEEGDLYDDVTLTAHRTYPDDINKLKPVTDTVNEWAADYIEVEISPDVKSGDARVRFEGEGCLWGLTHSDYTVKLILFNAIYPDGLVLDFVDNHENDVIIPKINEYDKVVAVIACKDHCFGGNGGYTFVMESPLYLDVVLDFDRSGSMGWDNKIAEAKAAAKAFVDLLEPPTGWWIFKTDRDKVGLVSYATTATLDLHLTSDFNKAKQIIDGYSAGGSTNMGDALLKSIGEIDTNGREGTIHSIVFFTDGRNNRGYTNQEVLNFAHNAGDKGIFIYTCGYGSDVDDQFLEDLAKAAGGKYYFAPDGTALRQIYIELSHTTKGWQPTASFRGTVSQGETKTVGTLNVQPGTSLIKVILTWPGSDLDLILIDPTGNQTLPGAGVIYSGNDTLPEYYEVYDPQPGNWTIQVYGKEITSPDEEYYVMVFQPGALMQVRPTRWVVNYPLNRTMIFNVSEVAGNLNLTNVTFTASDLTETVAQSTIKSLMKSQAEAEERGEAITPSLTKAYAQNMKVIPANCFSFTPNNFSVPAGGSVEVQATLTLPSASIPSGTYSGNIYVNSSGGNATISVTVIVTSVNTSTGTGTAYFASDAGSIEDLISLDESDLPEENPNVDFPHGLFSFNITRLNPNQTVNITIAFPQNIPTTAQYWKYGPNGSIDNPQPERWYQIPMGSNDGDDIITITLQDGGIGDDDGVANGVIVDQGGPGIPTAVARVPTLTPIGIIALAGLLLIIGISRIKKRK